MGGLKPADVLVMLALRLFELGVSHEGEPFGLLKAGPRVVHLLRGSKDSLRSLLAAHYWSEFEVTASTSAMADAILTLEGIARSAEPVELHLRVARHGHAVWVDLGDASGQAVKITSSGWSIEGQAPVLFKRTALTAPLPPPVPGDLGDLRKFLNVDDESWGQMAGWLVAAFIPDIPHVILAMTGEQGSAKSTAARLLVSLIDPSPAPLRAAPREITDFVVGASWSWVTAIDNVSGIPNWLSDALCRTVTGDGLVRRQLYSDNRVVVNSYRRVVALNGIHLGALRGDLVDRTTFVELQRIPPERRVEDGEMERAFDAVRPALLGGLFDLVSAVLRWLPHMELEELPRMADHARVLAALDQETGWNSLGAFLAVETRAFEEVVEGDEVATALRAFMDRRTEATWEGSATDLLAILSPDHPDKYWPKTPWHLSGRLRRAATALRAIGIEVTFPERTSAGRSIQIERTGNQASQASQASSRDTADTDDTQTPPPSPESATGATTPFRVVPAPKDG